MLLFIYLCDNCDCAGFLEINYKRWASDLNSSIDTIQGACKGLIRGLIFSPDESCLFIKNYLKHQKNYPFNKKNNSYLGIIKRFDLYAELFNIKDIETFIQGAYKGLTSPLGNGNGKGNGKGNNVKINFEFLENKLLRVQFEKWINYKKEIKCFYKTQTGIETAFKEFEKLSNKNIELAEKLINQAISKEWKGIYPLNDNDISKTEKILTSEKDYSEHKI